MLFSDDEVLHEDLVDVIPLSLAEHVVECEALPLTCISVDDVDPIPSGLLEHVVECETIPLTYIHTYYVEPISFSLVEPIYSNLVEPLYFSLVEIIYPNFMKHVVECEDIPLTYISLDMVEKHSLIEYSYQDFRV